MFTNKRIAINAVEENLKYHAETIATWLKTNPSSDERKVFEFLHSYKIGKGTLKTKNAPNNLLKSRIILIPNCSSKFGFDILTAFPVSH